MVATAKPGEFNRPGMVQTKAPASERLTTSRPETNSDRKPRTETPRVRRVALALARERASLTHEPKTEAAPRMESKPAVTHEPKTEAAPRIESKPTMTHEPKTEAAPGWDRASRDARARMEAAPRIESKPAVTHEPKTEAAPRMESKPTMTHEPKTEAAPRMESKPPAVTNRGRRRSMSPRPERKKTRRNSDPCHSAAAP